MPAVTTIKKLPFSHGTWGVPKIAFQRVYVENTISYANYGVNVFQHSDIPVSSKLKNVSSTAAKLSPPPYV